MIFLKSLLFLLIVFFVSSNVWTQEKEFSINKVIVNCGKSSKCENSKEKWMSLTGTYSGNKYLKEAIKVLLLEGNVNGFFYKLVKRDNNVELEVTFQVRPIISEIKIESNIDVELSQTKKLFSLKEGGLFDEEKVKNCELVIGNYLKDKGYHGYTISHELIFDQINDEAVIKFIVFSGVATLIDRLEITTDNVRIKKFIERQFKRFVDTPFDIIKLKNKVDDIRKDLFDSSYFNSNIEILNHRVLKNTNRIVLRMKVNVGSKFMFTFLGNKIFSRQELLEFIYELIKNNRNKLSIELIKKELVKNYELKGLYNNKINLEIKTEKIYGNEVVRHFYFYIREGLKVKIENVEFVGHSFFDLKHLTNLFYENATDLISRNFFEKRYIDEFSRNILKREYLRNGFIFVKIFRPKIKFSKNKKSVSIQFLIKEGIQSIVENITINGVDKNLKKKIIEMMNNRVSKFFDSTVLLEDLKRITKKVKNEGYYYATLKNNEASDIIQYSADYLKTFITLNISLGEKLYLDNIIITGNIKTKTKVILREVHISKSNIITPDHVQKIYSNLNSLGIFSQVRIDVLPGKVSKNKANLIIQISEKNSGLIELAPGYRTDIGLKMSLGVTYNNFSGMNRSIGFKGQVNQRLDYKGFDARRRGERKKKIEYSGKINFTEPYFFHYPLGFQASIDATRKRFFSFDAHIVRTNAIFSKSLTKNLSTSLKYQLESITQEDATDENDKGHFRIGGITPSMTLDFRDNRIMPSKGSYFNISLEVNNPTFLSQEKEDHEINFYKLVSRNKFYFPLKDGVFALSLSVGYQKNLVENLQGRKGAIPRIKVFRLNGMDIVRGFREDEINLLESGKDIYEVDINDKAYFVNLKVEPRYPIGDDTVLGIFFDAGGIYAQHFHPLRLRPSAGVSFKYLTPVGSLDFDYGIKILRKRLPNGNLERPGEFHISIGFF